jgi:hypothetical protein
VDHFLASRGLVPRTDEQREAISLGEMLGAPDTLTHPADPYEHVPTELRGGLSSAGIPTAEAAAVDAYTDATMSRGMGRDHMADAELAAAYRSLARTASGR